MEVDEAPRSKGRFNLDRAAQEHINEGLELWIPTRTSILPARFRDDVTDTPVNGRGTVGIHPEFNHEQQSGERVLVAS